MKAKIVEKSTDMFLNFGFKSITMDDISTEMGISKKTIYRHFRNKSDLIEKCTFYVFNIISLGIEAIKAQKMDPIEEIYEIKSFAMKHLKDEKSSTQYQLQKYYPKIYATLKEKQYELIRGFVTDNLRKGMTMGYFREDTDIDTVAKFYFNGIVALSNTKIFPPQHYRMPSLMEAYIEYHVRAIATPKGIEKLNQIIEK
ncbi:MAG: TetR/AcrR family transcriptional regulator [Sinomicrobium sp.]|nr:TetR/AcrR family transcriptional regulator [Sinomicrobium sp.]